ncbi:MAG TPA: gfo/Idh/MocA family oxidoreductase, partial [Kouleothrix sp.]|nr:gfo/Idh/MocA family oxidoreductase [Kouleothrix sp.]
MSIAIIGTGWGARIQVPAFRAAGLQVVALAGSDQAKTERIAGDLGVPFATGDWRAVLARPERRWSA